MKMKDNASPIMDCTVETLLKYMQENLDNGCLTMQSEVQIIDNWGDISSVKGIGIDCNALLLVSD